MGLQGRTIVSRVTELEAVSEDSKFVIQFTRAEDGAVTMAVRDSTKNYWDADKTTFRVSSREARSLAKMISGDNAEYDRSNVMDIPTGHFQLDVPQAEAVKAPEPGCSPIEVADAQARTALIQKDAQLEVVHAQMTLDHSRNLHVTADVQGCPQCEAKTLDRSY